MNISNQIMEKMMSDTEIKQVILKKFQTIPGVGKSIANDLWNMGFRGLNDLKGQDPEKMYDDFCNLVGYKIDRCMLYVFRCAVYFVENEHHDPERLKWWNWKDERIVL